MALTTEWHRETPEVVPSAQVVALHIPGVPRLIQFGFEVGYDAPLVSRIGLKAFDLCFQLGGSLLIPRFSNRSNWANTLGRQLGDKLRTFP